MKSILPKWSLLKRSLLLGISFQFLVVGLAFSSDNANLANQSIEDIYLSLEASDSDLEEVLVNVSDKTGFNFQYRENLVDNKRVSFLMDNVSLGYCLREIAKETGLSFKRINETIHVDQSNGQTSVTEELNSNTDQQDIRITGRVTADNGDEGLPGVTILVKGTQQGTISDIDGNYSLNVPSRQTVLVFSFVGYQPMEVTVGDQTSIDVALQDDVTALEEVVVVGYGEQRKETIVGSITQTNSEVIERTAGIPNIATALTGNLPGLITTASTGMPGQENPQIVIRGNNSWNGNGPLILVDGVSRPDFFNVMDVNSVESISVLKDASATAVFGSRGANGVILVTTKRGREGKAEITANFNSTIKVVSKLPGTRDGYDGIGLRNRAIEYELGISPGSWGAIIPQEIRDKYRNPANAAEAERYPNVDWQDEMFGDYAMAYNANVGVRGGTDLVRYFANIDIQSENDLFKDIENGRGYDPGYAYNRLNFRTNLDFQLTPTTKLQTNLGGSYGVRKSPWGGGNAYPFWIAAYGNSPTAYVPQYADGSYGYYQPNENAAVNSVRNLAISGVGYQTEASILTNFALEQDLSMLVKGLVFKGSAAFDNRFTENNRGVQDSFNDPRQKWIEPETGQVFFRIPFDQNTNFDYYTPGARWTPQGGGVNGGYRQLFYQLQLNYNTTIAQRHNLGLMGLMNRLQQANGSQVPIYREDWVFRATYNFDSKYLLEYNGAYNGSEKFGPGYRFAFFSSGGIGWVISQENFMKSIPFINYLKLRASYGETGDDGGIPRFAFTDNWAYGPINGQGGYSGLGTQGAGGQDSPYAWYRQISLGNPNVRWETVYKYNLALEFELFDGLIDGGLDLFRDRREDIYVFGDDRAVPSYFGAEAPAANIGEMVTQGFEATLGFSHTFSSGIRLWTDLAVTHAIDDVIYRDDPELLADYQKQAGYQLGQARTYVSSGYYSTWDELYASTTHNTNNQNKLPGNYHLLDYNADGIIDNLDNIPYGFSGTPQNTYNATIGFDWKGFSAFIQLYAVNNVTRWVEFSSLGGQTNRAYEEGSYWSKDNTNPDTPMPRWLSLTVDGNDGSRYYYDGSYLRLKNAEVAYRFTSGWVNKIGLSSLRVYANGNNLLLWTDMPDDRESNFATGLASQGAYPTVKRINLGLNLVF